MTAAMANVRSAFLADKEAVSAAMDAEEKRMTKERYTRTEETSDNTPRPRRKPGDVGEQKRVAGCSTYDAILERKWTVYEDATDKPETLSDFSRLGMDIPITLHGHDEEDIDDPENSSWCEAYNRLTGNPIGEAITTDRCARDVSSDAHHERRKSIDSWIQSYADTVVGSPGTNNFDSYLMDENTGAAGNLSRPHTPRTSFTQSISTVIVAQTQREISLQEQGQRSPSWRPSWGLSFDDS